MTIYECDHCGACCTGNLIIEADPMDVLREPRIASECKIMRGMDHSLPILETVWSVACVDPCPFHRDLRCAIYPTRPNVCVGFQAGSDQCQQSRRRVGLAPLNPVEREGVLAEIQEEYTKEEE